MRRKLQVFVSSTYTDMLPERQAAVEAILRADHIPAGMELFAAGNESQWETIQRWIDDSDVYMLILGGRYGSIEPNSGKSYIQLEYEYAIEKNKPVFAAVIDEAYLTSKVKEIGPDAMERVNGLLLNTFREMVTGKICRFFKDLGDLKLIVFESLANLNRNEQLGGWIRGSEVIDPKSTLEEVSRLQGENVTLRNKITDLETVTATFLGAQPAQSLSNALSDDAKELLVTAATSNGVIMHMRFMGGASIQAGGRNFINPMTDREEARWKASIGELRENRLVEMTSSKNAEIFKVTKRGYEIADEIRSGANDGRRGT